MVGRPVSDRGDVRGRSFGILSTVPPIASARFSVALPGALVAHGATVEVVWCGAGGIGAATFDVASRQADGSAGVVNAAAALNDVEVAVVQHGEDVYGGSDRGADVLRVLGALTVPAVVVAHRRSVLRRHSDDSCWNGSGRRPRRWWS